MAQQPCPCHLPRNEEGGKLEAFLFSPTGFPELEASGLRRVRQTYEQSCFSSDVYVHPSFQLEKSQAGLWFDWAKTKQLEKRPGPSRATAKSALKKYSEVAELADASQKKANETAEEMLDDASENGSQEGDIYAALNDAEASEVVKQKVKADPMAAMEGSTTASSGPLKKRKRKNAAEEEEPDLDNASSVGGGGTVSNVDLARVDPQMALVASRYQAVTGGKEALCLTRLRVIDFLQSTKISRSYANAVSGATQQAMKQKGGSAYDFSCKFVNAQLYTLTKMLPVIVVI